MIDFFGIKLHLYGLLIGLGALVAWEIALRFGKVKREVIEKMALATIFWGVVGARTYHVVDLWSYYSSDLVKVFYLWNGGLGIWGGIIGGLIYLAFFSYKNKLNYFLLSDSVVLGLPLAQAIGRLGNWVNGELYGKNGEMLFAWEGALNVLLFFLLFWINKRSKNLGSLTGAYLVGYGVIRIVLENFRPEEIIWKMGGIPVAVIMSLMAIIVGLVVIIKKPT